LDLVLAGTQDGYRLHAHSALGMVWLQTHFDDAVWDHLAAGRVQVGRPSADLLCEDALAAGLRISRTPHVPLPLGERS
jgi:hypothetical protein